MDKLYTMKIVMLGESGVGKTCILEKYISESFSNTKATDHACFKTHLITTPDKKHKIKQILWDTAGQEVYRSLASFYYRDADCVVLVYDITSERSFKELEYWIQQVKMKGKRNAILTIVGNKIDKANDEQVKESVAKAFAKENNATHFLTSALEDINITEMYTDLALRKFPKLQTAFKKNLNVEDLPTMCETNLDMARISLFSKVHKPENKCC